MAEAAKQEEFWERPRVGLTATKAAALGGVAYQTLVNWDVDDFIKPSVAPGGRGAGRKRDRLYSVDDVILIRTAAELRRAGVKLPRLPKVLGYLKQAVDLANPPKAATLVVVPLKNDVDVEIGSAKDSVRKTLGKKTEPALSRIVLDLECLIDLVRDEAEALLAEAS